MDERIAPALDRTRTRLRVWVVVASFAACLVFAGNASAAIAEVTTTGNVPANYRFSPATVTVTAGDTVNWTNAGGAHNVHFTGEMLGTPNVPGTAGWPVTRPFNSAGTFTYFCDPHQASGMVGTVTVLAAAPPPSGGGGGGGTPGGDPGTGGQPGDDTKTDLKKLQLKLSDATPSKGTRVRFYGSIRPAIEGRVLIQRRSRNGEYKTVTRVTLKDGKFSKRLRAKAGVYRAVIGETADHDDATSKTKRIR